MSDGQRNLIATRGAQMFPRLTDDELDAALQVRRAAQLPRRRNGRPDRRGRAGTDADPVGRSRRHSTRRRGLPIAHRHPRARQFHGRAGAAFGPAGAGRLEGADRCGRHSDPAGTPARAADRRSGPGRADHARADPSAHGPDRSRRRPGHHRQPRATRTSCGSSISFAATAIPICGSTRSGDNCARTLVEPVRGGGRRASDRPLSERQAAPQSDRASARPLRRAGRPDRYGQALRPGGHRRGTVRDWRLRSMRDRRACRS